MGAAQLLANLRAADFSLRTDGARLTVAPSSRLSDAYRADIKANKAALMALLLAPERPFQLTLSESGVAHADAWDDAAIARFQARARHLRGRGLNEQDADDMAEQLHLRDVHADHRRLCLECRHYRRGRCWNHNEAGLMAVEVASDLVTMFQDCPGFAEVL